MFGWGLYKSFIMSDKGGLSDKGGGALMEQNVRTGRRDLVEPVEAACPATLAALAEKAAAFMVASTAGNTKRAYRTAWKHFSAWCAKMGFESLPAAPATVGLYLTDAAATAKLTTLRLRLAAISQAHKTAGKRLDTAAPEIRKVMSGVARTKGAAVTKKQALTGDLLRDVVRAYAPGDRLKEKRDRAILITGFFGAMRRSELVAINVEDIVFVSEGAILTLPRRKTDQEGHGSELGLPAKDDPLLCPVTALKSWIAAAQIEEGPLFRSISKSGRLLDRRMNDKDVARIVKAATTAAGYPPSEFSAHSLRSGFITTAARKGVPERIIAAQSGHRSIAVLHGYVRRAGLFRENAADLI